MCFGSELIWWGSDDTDTQTLVQIIKINIARLTVGRSYCITLIMKKQKWSEMMWKEMMIEPLIGCTKRWEEGKRWMENRKKKKESGTTAQCHRPGESWKMEVFICMIVRLIMGYYGVAEWWLKGQKAELAPWQRVPTKPKNPRLPCCYGRWRTTKSWNLNK